MSKKQEAAKLLSAKNLIEPLEYLIEFHEEKTGLSPEKYYQIRYELAKRNNNRKQAEQALEFQNVFNRE